MAGQLTISTLNDSAGVLATQNGMSGIAKAWVNFNGTGTVAIRGSFNVSSVTDLGVGRYQVNYTTAMPDANVSVVGMCQYDPNADDINSHIAIRRVANALTTTYAQVVTGPNTSNAPEDTTIICVTVFR